jgi:hypothetical protein
LEVFIGDLAAILPQLLHHLVYVDRIPNDDRIDEQVQTANLIEQMHILWGAKLGSIGKGKVSA